MPLKSPRFRQNAQLKDAYANRPCLTSGANGIGVHLLQFALIDLGFPLPNSVGGNALSPDGRYGSETAHALASFQRSSLGGAPVKDDGIAGGPTLAKLDRAIGGFTHRVRIHLRVVHTPDRRLSHYVKLAKAAYAQYGIDFHVASTLPLRLDPAKKAWLEKQSTTGADVIDDPPKSILAPLFPVKLRDVLVYSLELFDPDTVYGLTASNAKGAVVRLSKDQQASTLAHEVGHALLTPLNGVDTEDHHPSCNNVMGTGTRVGPYVFTIEQIRQMRTHLRCTAI